MPLSSKKEDLFYLLILSLVAALFIAITWHRWGDAVTDCGKDLVAAARVAHGEVLYRDIQYNYGPFSPYLRGFLFSILGANMDVAVASGILSLFSALFFMYFIARKVLPRFYSFFFALSFLLLCAVSQYIGIGGYNFVIPYAAPAVDGFILSCALLLFLRDFAEKRSLKSLIAGSFCSSLLLLTKMEFAAASLIAWFFTLISLSAGIWTYMIFTGTALIPAISIYMLFAFSAGLKNLVLDNIFPEHIATAGNFLFPKRLMGIENLPLSLEAASVSLAMFFAVSAVGVLSSRWSRPLWISATIVLAIASHVVLEPYLIFRFLPPLITGLFVYYAYRILIGRERDGGTVFFAALSLFSIVITLRIFLNLGAYYFGFYLLPLPLLVLYTVLFDKIPGRFIKPELHKRYIFVVITFLLAAFANHLITSALHLGDKEYRISGRNGWLYTDKIRGPILNAALKFLDEAGGGGGGLLSFPEGALLNFISGIPLRSFYSSFVPPEIPSEKAEERVISDIERNEVKFIAILSRDVSEFGSAGFGKDYATEIVTHIKEKYRLTKTFESANGMFWIHIFVRK